jgi:hypothetical protein
MLRSIEEVEGGTTKTSEISGSDPMLEDIFVSSAAGKTSSNESIALGRLAMSTPTLSSTPYSKLSSFGPASSYIISGSDKSDNLRPPMSSSSMTSIALAPARNVDE